MQFVLSFDWEKTLYGIRLWYVSFSFLNLFVLFCYIRFLLCCFVFWAFIFISLLATIDLRSYERSSFLLFMYSFMMTCLDWWGPNLKVENIFWIKWTTSTFSFFLVCDLSETTLYLVDTPSRTVYLMWYGSRYMKYHPVTKTLIITLNKFRSQHCILNLCKISIRKQWEQKKNFWA